MNQEVRERLLLPVGIPVGAALLIVAVVLIFSRVLLAVPAEIAVAVALMAAVNILAAGAIVTWRPRMGSIDYALLGGVALVPVVAGIFVAAGAFEVKEGGEEHRPAVQELSLAAQTLAFDLKELVLKSGAPAVITFTNNEAVAHNVAIYNNPQDASTQQNAIFDGKTFTGPATQKYRVKTLQPGSFVFQCDVHPAQMTGTVRVEASEEPEGPAKPADVKITAQNSVFDLKELSVPAGIASNITLDNKDALTHNISVYRSQADAQTQQNPVVKGPLFAGPATRRVRIRPPAAGTYYFQCDVHAPQMNGALTAT